MVYQFQEHQDTPSNIATEALGTYLAMPKGKTCGVVNTLERIISLIDEAHRTQAGTGRQPV